tara:strand:- start:74 stop:793 length:720 start_codon:yes stop_codon:yes gene_type:complete
MIKFFRKIRQNLLSEGKTGKYLKYAIGEIVLVVIGILIALQINNWNENQKAKSYERKMLLEVIEDLKSDSTLLQGQFRRIKIFEETIDQLLVNPNAIENKDGQIRLFGGVYLIQNTKSIETIKSGNIQIPFDDELRKTINNHYHNTRFYLDLLSIEDKDFREFRSIPLQKAEFRIQIDSTSKTFDIDPVPLSYEATLKSRAFNDYLLLRKSRINRWKLSYERIYTSTIECINAITYYLE